MFRTRAIPALRTASRQTCNARPATRRYLTTEPPHLKSRSWKSSALRWGIAVAGIYYYNTSPVFAEHPQSNLLNPDVDAIDSDSPTIDRLLESSKQNSKHKSTLQSAIETGSQKQVEQTEENHAALQSISHADESSQSSDDGLNEVPAAAGAADLEEEAAGEGAFNPVTGEINWDCPCLGGMAYGPCGEEFRTAFSCFVYSTDEPKGMDCVEKFGAMQDCFRAHPEVYAGEIDEDESEEMGEEKELLRKEIEEKKEQAQQIQKDKEEQVKPKTQKQEKKEKKPQQDAKKSTDPEEAGKSQIVRKPKTKKVDDAVSESENLVPKAAHDATQMDEGATHSVAR